MVERASERACDEVVERESVWSGGQASERALNEKHVNIFFCDIHKVHARTQTQICTLTYMYGCDSVYILHRSDFRITILTHSVAELNASETGYNIRYAYFLILSSLSNGEVQPECGAVSVKIIIHTINV